MTLQINLFSSLGLLIDIFGVILLFMYGLPSKISEGDYFTDGEPEEMKLKRISRNNYIKRMAHVGLICLIVGFVLQLVGTNIQC